VVLETLLQPVVSLERYALATELQPTASKLSDRPTCCRHWAKMLEQHLTIKIAHYPQ
jgi:hypothetical protein